MESRSAPYVRSVFVCCNEREPGEAACANRGSADLQKTLKAWTKEHGIGTRCRVSRAMCLGLCEEGPNLCIMPDNVWLRGVTPADLPKIIATYLAPLA